MPMVVMDASAIGGKIHTSYSGVVETDEDGLIIVDSHDIPELLAAGALNVQLSREEMDEKIVEMAEAQAERQEEIARAARSHVELGPMEEDPDLLPDPNEPGIAEPEKARRQAARDGVVERNDVLRKEREERRKAQESETEAEKISRERREGAAAAAHPRSSPASTPTTPTPTPSNQRQNPQR